MHLKCQHWDAEFFLRWEEEKVESEQILQVCFCYQASELLPASVRSFQPDLQGGVNSPKHFLKEMLSPLVNRDLKTGGKPRTCESKRLFCAGRKCLPGCCSLLSILKQNHEKQLCSCFGVEYWRGRNGEDCRPALQLFLCKLQHRQYIPEAAPVWGPGSGFRLGTAEGGASGTKAACFL